MNRFGLTIAVPRGALLRETLDLLDLLGVDTAEVRANDRKLLFRDVGIVTMRPSDVPTYVEAGAADIGITGKDVLMEQVERLPEEGAARDRDRQPGRLAHDARSRISASCSGCALSANPTAGSGRPKRPSSSS